MADNNASDIDGNPICSETNPSKDNGKEPDPFEDLIIRFGTWKEARSKSMYIKGYNRWFFCAQGYDHNDQVPIDRNASIEDGKVTPVDTPPMPITVDLLNRTAVVEGFDKETTKFEELCEFYKDTPGVVHITYRGRKGGQTSFLGYISLVFATADVCFDFLASDIKPPYKEELKKTLAMTKALTTRAEVKEREQLRAQNRKQEMEYREAKIRQKVEKKAKHEALLAEQKAATVAKKAAKRAAHEELMAEIARRKIAKTEATLNAPYQHWAGQNAGGNFGAHHQPGPSFYPGPSMHAEAHHRPEWDTQAAWGQGNKARHPMMGMNKWNTKNTKWEY